MNAEAIAMDVARRLNMMAARLMLDHPEDRRVGTT
jgi:hypothetical protein